MKFQSSILLLAVAPAVAFTGLSNVGPRKSGVSNKQRLRSMNDYFFLNDDTRHGGFHQFPARRGYKYDQAILSVLLVHFQWRRFVMTAIDVSCDFGRFWDGFVWE